MSATQGRMTYRIADSSAIFYKVERDGQTVAYFFSKSEAERLVRMSNAEPEGEVVGHMTRTDTHAEFTLPNGATTLSFFDFFDTLRRDHEYTIIDLGPVRIPPEASTERCGGSREIWLGAYPAGGEIHEATTPCPGCSDCTGDK